MSWEQTPPVMLQAVYLQCSAKHLQLGGGGKFLFSLASAQSFPTFRNSLHSACNLCTPLTRLSVPSDFWWLFRKLWVCLQRYLHQWESVLHAGKLSVSFCFVRNKLNLIHSAMTFLQHINVCEHCKSVMSFSVSPLLPLHANLIGHLAWEPIHQSSPVKTDRLLRSLRWFLGLGSDLMY